MNAYRSAVIGVALACGCGGGGGDTRAAPQPAAISAAAPTDGRGALPTTAAEFLAELVPQPGGDLVVVYQAHGPAQMSGTLELLSRAGGFRRENWTLEVPIPGSEPARIEGTTIQTPKQIWSATGTAAGTVSPSPLEPLAHAYLKLERAKQAKIVGSLRRLARDVDQLRGEQPGDVREIAGQRCLEVRVGGQRLCLWEQAGVPLAYRGGAFSFEATHVQQDPKLGPGAFELPAAAAAAQTIPLPEAFALDPNEALRALENGNYGPLSLILQPGLRLPTAPQP